MRVLDKRPRTVRFMSNLWGRGPSVRGFMAKKPESTHLAARFTAKVADGLIARRVAARNLSEACPALVSIGNLALGGTGKTPVVAALADDLASAGWKGAVLTRGFGSPLTGPLTVDPDNDLAGDEARLIAATLVARGWPVIQARRRKKGLDHLLEVYPGTEVVIVEDGHQTAHLGRHLDVVILDGWFVNQADGREKVCAATGPVFPFGPWRESSAGADRAGIWLLETEKDMPAEGRGAARDSIGDCSPGGLRKFPGEDSEKRCGPGGQVRGPCPIRSPPGGGNQERGTGCRCAFSGDHRQGLGKIETILGVRLPGSGGRSGDLLGAWQDPSRNCRGAPGGGGPFAYLT